MDGPALSGRERRLLDEIEGDLRQDARLERQLSTMEVRPPNRLLSLLRRVPPGLVLVVSATTAICMSIGARTPTPVVLTAVAAVWAVTVAVSVGVTVALQRRRAAAEAAAGSAAPGPSPTLPAAPAPPRPPRPPRAPRGHRLRTRLRERRERRRLGQDHPRETRPWEHRDDPPEPS